MGIITPLGAAIGAAPSLIIIPTAAQIQSGNPLKRLAYDHFWAAVGIIIPLGTDYPSRGVPPLHGGKLLEVPGERYLMGGVPPNSKVVCVRHYGGGPLPSRWILLLLIRGTGEMVFEVTGKRYRYRVKGI